MERHHFSKEQPVRITRKWAAAIAGLLGIGAGVAATMATVAHWAPPPPPPAPVVVMPAVVVPAPVVVRPEFDVQPWMANLRAGIADVKASMSEMPPFKAPAYKGPFDAITGQVEALETTVSEFEQAAAQHKADLETPSEPMAGASAPVPTASAPLAASSEPKAPL